MKSTLLLIMFLGYLWFVEGNVANWQNYPGEMTRVAVGPKGVWGVTRGHDIYKKTANYWEKVGGALKDISVGKDSVWGVTKNDDIYMRTGAGGWQHIPGKLMQVSVSGFHDSVVWGVYSGNNIYRRKGNTWDKVGGALIVVSCGEAGVWGVNRNNDIYYRTGTYGGAVSAGTGWEKVGGGLSWISSGAAGEVWGVNTEDKIFRRDGVTEGNPTGTGWSFVGQSYDRLTQVDVFGGTAWGVNSDQKIWIWKSDSDVPDVPCAHPNMFIDGGIDIIQKLGLPEQLLTKDSDCYNSARCKSECQNSNKVIATCTGWQFSSDIILYHLYLTCRASCRLFNGDFGFKSAARYRDKSAILNLPATSGRVYCDYEKRAIIDKLSKSGQITAGWRLVKTCSNRAGQGTLTCTYYKKVGISKTSSTSATSSSTEEESNTLATEFSATFGLETSDPLGTVKTKFEATMSVGTSSTSGFSWTESHSSSEAFTTNSETRTGFSFDVLPDSTRSVCQPVGNIGEFEIKVDHSCLVDGVTCDKC